MLLFYFLVVVIFIEERELIRLWNRFSWVGRKEETKENMGRRISKSNELEWRNRPMERTESNWKQICKFSGRRNRMLWSRYSVILYSICESQTISTVLMKAWTFELVARVRLIYLDGVTYIVVMQRIEKKEEGYSNWTRSRRPREWSSTR